jgi:putative MATE family efflux protein
VNATARRELIQNGNLYKVLLMLSLPIMVNSFIQTLFNLVDGLWVSKLGSVQIAALSFVWPVNFLFVSLGIGISVAGIAILAQLVGADKATEAGRYASQLIALSTLLSIGFAAAGYFLSPTVLEWMGARGDMLEYSSIYLRITFLDMPFMFLFFNYYSIMNAQGNTLQPTILSAISAILNGVLDPIFIFTLDLGVAGAALATLLTKILLCVAGLIMLRSGHGMILVSFRHFRFDPKILRQIVKIAVPASVGQTGSALGFMVLNAFIVSYGTATLAAFGMVNRITGLVMQPSMSIGAALTAVVGINLGNCNIRRVQESFNKSMLITLVVSWTGCLALLIWNYDIVTFFIRSRDDMAVIEQGVVYMRYIAFSMPLMGIISVFQGIFQGSGHTKYSMAIEIGRLWCVRIPMILLFKYFTDVGPSGIWFSMSVSNLIICIVGYMVYRSNKWQQTVLV